MDKELKENLEDVYYQLDLISESMRILFDVNIDDSGPVESFLAILRKSISDESRRPRKIVQDKEKMEEVSFE